MVHHAFSQEHRFSPPRKKIKTLPQGSPDVTMTDPNEQRIHDASDTTTNLGSGIGLLTTAEPPLVDDDWEKRVWNQYKKRTRERQECQEQDAFATNTMLDQVNKEIACGISQYVCPQSQGLKGVLKKRYTDFLVNEILPSGLVVHLDNTQAPKHSKKKENTHDDRKSTSMSHVSGSSQPLDNTPLTTTSPNDASPADSTVLSGNSSSMPSKPLSTVSTQQKPLDPFTETQVVQSHTLEDPGGSSIPSITSSMQDHDAAPEKPENLSPHMRKLPPSSSGLMNQQQTDIKQAVPSPTRTRQTVRIRHTDQGWIEVDRLKEEELLEGQPSETAANEAPSKDALVHEGMKEGSEVMRREMEPPKVHTTQASWQAFASATSAEAAAPTKFQLKSEDKTALLSYFTPDVVDGILALHDRIINLPLRKAKDYGTVKSAAIDRQTRSKIHQDLRRMFESRLETVTDKDGAMIVTAVQDKPTFHGRTPMNHVGDNNRGNHDRNHNNRGRGGRGNINRDSNSRANNKTQWADLGGDYLHFSLCKENKDTMEAISWLVKQLNMRATAFQFAGTKDRRGVTTQRVSVYRVFAERMVGAGRSLKSAKIGNFEYQPHPLRLGELKGNEFTITLRDCYIDYPYTPPDSKAFANKLQAIIGEAMRNLATNGFINYYGLQRFGTFSTSTDQVGLKMLQGDFEAAVNNILSFNPASLAAAQDPESSANDKVSREDRARAVAINAFKTTGTSYAALHDLPKKFSAESVIMLHLGKPNNSKDFFGAIQNISRNMRLMYVHAYQSLVWNMAASERWKRFGATVIEGDLVLVNEHKDKLGSEIKDEDVDADGEPIVHPSADDRATDPEEMFARARALTKEEVESNKYTIFDIVLPTPGHDIIYPANEMVKFYEDFMASERGGGLDPHDMKRKWKDISLSGSYRKLLAKPGEDFSYEVKIHTDENEQFVETDLERLEKAKRERMEAQHKRSAPLRDDPAKASDHPEGVADGSKSEEQHTASSSDSEGGGIGLNRSPNRFAVILKLQLGSSQYATMALRELMKKGGARTYKPDFGGGR